MTEESEKLTMKLSDLIDHIEYVSDDNGSISHAEIRETSEDGKTVDIYCRSRRTLYNYLFVARLHAISINVKHLSRK